MYKKAKSLLTLLFCLFRLSISTAAESEFNFRWILPPEYYQGKDFYDGRAWVQEKKDGPWTLFDTEGNVIKKDFNANNIMQGHNEDTRFESIEKDSETGWNMYGVIDHSGNIISEPKPYKYPPFIQEGMVLKQGENGLWGYVDFQENWVVLPAYEGFILWGDGLMPAKKDGKWGYINKEGEVVIDFCFEQAYSFRNGLAAASQNSLYGLIDLDGNWVTEAVYERFYYPMSNLIADQIAAQKEGKIGYLDAKGNVVIDFKFTGIDGMRGGTSSSGIAAFHEGRATVPLSKKGQGRDEIYTLGVINEFGDIVSTKQDTFMTAYSNGFAVAVRDKELFMLDRDGKEHSLPSVFQQEGVNITRSDDGIFRVHFKKEDKTGYFKVKN